LNEAREGIVAKGRDPVGPRPDRREEPDGLGGGKIATNPVPK